MKPTMLFALAVAAVSLLQVATCLTIPSDHNVTVSKNETHWKPWEVSSCKLDYHTCTQDTDCCSGLCVTPRGGAFTEPDLCVPNPKPVAIRGETCAKNLERCVSDGDCCTGTCTKAKSVASGKRLQMICVGDVQVRDSDVGDGDKKCNPDRCAYDRQCCKDDICKDGVCQVNLDPPRSATLSMRDDLGVPNCGGGGQVEMGQACASDRFCCLGSKCIEGVCRKA